MIETDENVKGSTTRGDVKDALKQIFTATSFILGHHKFNIASSQTINKLINVIQCIK